jgi:hypothetical protein
VTRSTHLRRLGWLALLATGVALYVASLSGMASVRGELTAATSQGPPAQALPVAYREEGPMGSPGEGDRRGCHERGGRDRSFPSTRDF